MRSSDWSSDVCSSDLLWTGERVSHAGRFFQFEAVDMRPPTRQAGGPPIWCGGRSDGALRRTGWKADGWLSYAVTPDMYRESLEKIGEIGRASCRERGCQYV